MASLKGTLSRQDTVQAPGTPPQQRAPPPRSANRYVPSPHVPNPQSEHPNPEQRLKETIEYNNRARLTAMNAIQSNRRILRQSQETIDAIQARIAAKHGRLSAADLTDLASEKNRLALWKRQNVEKMEGCKRLIGLMDAAEEELMRLRPMTEEERRNGSKALKLFCTIPKAHRLAVGASPEIALGKAPIRPPLSTVVNNDWRRV